MRPPGDKPARGVRPPGFISERTIFNARSRHRRRRPDARRPSLQGLARLAAPRRDPRVRGRPAARAQPRCRPDHGRGAHRRLRPAAGPAGQQHRPHRGAAERQARADHQRRDRLALLRVRPRRHPQRRQRGRRGPGRRLHRRRRRVRLALQRRAGGRPPRGSEREPPGQQRPAQRLHRDGPDRRERRRQVRRLARGPGPLRPALAGARGRGPGGRRVRPRDRARHARRRHGRLQGRRAARLVDLREAGDAGARVQAGRHRHGRQLVPAQRRRGRRADHERREGRGARA